MTRKRLLPISLVGLLVAFGCTRTTWADNIDIYTSPGTPSADGMPLVMFSLDYHTSLGANVCNGNCSAGIIQLHTDGYLAENPNTTAIKRFAYLRAVLKKFFYNIDDLKVGLMLSHANNCSGGTTSGPTKTGCSNGGYIASGFKEFQVTRDGNGNITNSDANGNKAAFLDILSAMPNPQGSLNHPYQLKETFFEFYRYLSGKNIYNGHLGYKDYGDNSAANNLNVDWPAMDWDSAIENGAAYVTPFSNATMAACAKVYTVNLLYDQTPTGSDGDSNTAIADSTNGIPGVTSVGNNQSDVANVIRQMYLNDMVPENKASGKQNVTSYFVVDPGKVNATTRSYAGAGQGLSSAEPYTLSDNPDTLIEELTRLFRNILSTSTTFVAPSVAVNVYNRAQVLDDVYIAMFQAHESGYPGWHGNLKKFALGINTSSNESELQDVTDANAVAADGRIKFSALSYWTRYQDLPAAPSGAGLSTDIVTGKDGRIVNRGGAGAKIPGFKLLCDNTSYLTDPDCTPGSYTPGLVNPADATAATETTARKVYYDDPTQTGGTFNRLRALNADTTTATALRDLLTAEDGADADTSPDVGTCNNAETNPLSACALLTWARGNYYDAAGTLRARNWLLNDILHSRPLAVNYGIRGGYTNSDNPDIRIIAGSNDGFLHMFRNTSTAQTSVAQKKTPNEYDGVEAWAFMPRELMPLIKTLKKNEYTAMTDPRHPYGLDGTPVVVMQDLDSDGNIEPSHCETISGTSYCDKVYLYFGLRRGGAAYYALDITDPDNPIFMWKITPTVNAAGTSSSDFAQMKQTWSTPKTAMMVFNGNAVALPVLIFGGGYNENKDTHAGHGAHVATAIGTDDDAANLAGAAGGNALFVVNAVTGELIWKAVGSCATAGYVAATKTYCVPGMKDSIPSDITIVDANANGLADRLYFGDTAGTVWRADVFCKNQDGTGCATSPSDLDSNHQWRMTKLFSIGRHDGNTLPNDRRFFYAPAWVPSNDSTGDFDAVVVTTGDRENPKDTSVENYIYMFKDRGTLSDAPASTAAQQHGDFTDVTCSGLDMWTCSTVNSIGWKLKLELCPSGASSPCGEKGLSAPIAIGTQIYLTTYVPPASSGGASSCGLDEGIGFLYALSVKEGAPVEDLNSANNTSTQTLFRTDRYAQLDSKGIPSEIVSLGGGKYLRPDLKVGAGSLKSGYKTFWYNKGK
jgi:type IV pilus assembly protein PilY1